MISGFGYQLPTILKFRATQPEAPENPYSDKAIAKVQADIWTMVEVYDIPPEVVEKARQDAFYEGLENHHYGCGSRPTPFYQLDFLSEWVRKNRHIH